MAVEDAADWDVFLDGDVFAAAATWTRPAMAGVTVRGIRAEAHAVAAGGDFPGVSTTAPVFTTAAAELPADAAQGDTLTIDGAPWRVADLQPDGAGMVRVILEG